MPAFALHDAAGLVTVEIRGEGAPPRCTPDVVRSVFESISGLRRGALRGVILRATQTGLNCEHPAWDVIGPGGGGQWSDEAVGTALRQRLQDLEVPTLAVLTGETTGAGLALALACDLRIATPTVSVSCGGSEHQRLCHGLAALLTVLAGRSTAIRMLLGEQLSAASAARLGIITEVIDPAQLADRLDALFPGSRGPQAAQAVSRAVRAVEELPPAEASRFGSQLARQMEPGGASPRKPGPAV